MEIHGSRDTSYLAGARTGGLALTAGALASWAASDAPALVPVALLGAWAMSKAVERPDSERERYLMLAGAAASAAASWVAPGLSGAVFLGQAVLQGCYAAATTRPPQLPWIPKEQLAELMGQKTGHSDTQAMLAQLGPLKAIQVAEEVYREHLTPQHLQAIDAFHDIPFQDGQARRLVESCLRGPFPGKVYSYRQSRSDDGAAVASGSNLAFSQEFLQRADPITQWFTVGHELSHIRHRDACLTLGAQGIEALSQGRWSAELLDRARIPLHHQNELRADREGVDMALSQGARADQVLERVNNFIGASRAGTHHPSGPQRVAAVRKYLYG